MAFPCDHRRLMCSVCHHYIMLHFYFILFLRLPSKIDCCDGSDEYDGKVNCSNTCWEAGKASRDKLKKKIVTYQGGAAIRKKEVEHTMKAITEGEAELVKLKTEEKILKGLAQKLKAHCLTKQGTKPLRQHYCRVKSKWEELNLHQPCQDLST